MANLSAEYIDQIEEILFPHVSEADGYDEDDSDFRSTGDYKDRHWDMVRELKGVRCMASLPGYLAVPIMQQVLSARNLSLTDLGYESEEDAIDSLESLWDRAKLALGEAPLSAAVRMSLAHPVTFETRRLSEKYQSFLNIAYQLQLMRDDDYIALPVKALADILEVTPQRVSSYRDYAKKDGYLVEESRYRWNPNGGGVATKFHFRWEGKKVEVPSTHLGIKARGIEA